MRNVLHAAAADANHAVDKEQSEPQQTVIKFAKMRDSYVDSSPRSASLLHMFSAVRDGRV